MNSSVGVTVQEILDALDKNGYPWTKGNFFEGKTKASCALGQIVRNLFPGIDPDDIPTIGFFISDRLRELTTLKSLINYNDSDAESLSAVQAWAHKQYDKLKEQEIYIPKRYFSNIVGR